MCNIHLEVESWLTGLLSCWEGVLLDPHNTCSTVQTGQVRNYSQGETWAVLTVRNVQRSCSSRRNYNVKQPQDVLLSVSALSFLCCCFIIIPRSLLHLFLRRKCSPESQCFQELNEKTSQRNFYLLSHSQLHLWERVPHNHWLMMSFL